MPSVIRAARSANDTVKSVAQGRIRTAENLHEPAHSFRRGGGAAIRLAAITDEFSPDLEVALTAMSSIGMTGVELRVIGGKNIVDLDRRRGRARINEAVKARGMTVISIASPVLKCVLPEAPPPDSRLQQDIFGSAFTFEDQPRLARRALEIARMTGAGIVRVFSYWRTVEGPAACFDRGSPQSARRAGAPARGGGRGHRTRERSRVQYGDGMGKRSRPRRRRPSGFQPVWDPANALVLGDGRTRRATGSSRTIASSTFMPRIAGCTT